MSRKNLSKEEAFLLQHTVDGMLLRLSWMTLQPAVIVDLGCKIDYSSEQLKKRYSDAKIIVQERGGGEEEIISLPDHSVDLIFANLVLPWCQDVKATLQSWRRIVKPEGIILFSSLGPDTLIDLNLPREKIIPIFADMHDVGDALMQARFSDPVLDVDYVTVRYREGEKLIRELHAIDFLADDVEHIEPNVEQGYQIRYEVVYGHAFGPDIEVDHVMDDEGMVRVPLAHLRNRMR